MKLRVNIHTLIQSTDKDETISGRLIKLLEKRAQWDWESIRFAGGQTFFHLLVKKNRAILIENLLKRDPRYITHALISDRRGQTILHYVVKPIPNCQDSLKVILSNLPAELINKQDHRGNTALHLAKFKKCQIAIDTLLQTGKVNPEIANNNGKTNLELLAMPSSSQSALPMLDLRSLAPTKKKALPSDLRNTFNRLVSPRRRDSSMPVRARSASIASSSTAIIELHEFSSSRSDSSWDRTILLNDVILNQAPDLQFIKKIIDYSTTTCKFDSESWVVEQFISLCQHRQLSIPDELIYATSSHLHAINFILHELHPVILAFKEKYDKKIGQLTQQIETLLLEQGLTSPQLIESIPDFKSIHPEKEATLRLIWSLITYKTKDQGSIQFNRQRASYQLLYLKNKFPPSELLGSINLIFPYLSPIQQLTTYFLIWKLIAGTELNPRFDLTQIKDELNSFIEVSSKKSHIITEQAERLNQYLLVLIKLVEEHQSCPLFSNYNLILSWQKAPFFNMNKDSFDQLIDSALQQKPRERQVKVRMMVDQLKMITVRFYQELNLADFVDGQWSIPTEDINRSAITLQSHFFNQLSNYLKSKLINQPKRNIANSLRLLLEIGSELCSELGPESKERQHDLNTLMIIMSVINHTSIIRLSHYIKQFTPQENYIFDQLNQLVSPDNNFSMMRFFCNQYPNALPFLGGYLTSITFSKEGNTDLLERAEIQGKILTELLAISDNAQTQLALHHSDLQQFIQEYTPEEDDDELYYASRRIQPSSSDLIELDSKSQEIKPLLQYLNTEFLNYNLIPLSLINGKKYAVEQTAAFLILWCEQQLKSAHRSTPVGTKNELIDLRESTIKKLDDIDLLKSITEKLELIDLLESTTKKLEDIDPLESKIKKSKLINLLDSITKKLELIDLLESTIKKLEVIGKNYYKINFEKIDLKASIENFDNQRKDTKDAAEKPKSKRNRFFSFSSEPSSSLSSSAPSSSSSSSGQTPRTRF